MTVITLCCVDKWGRRRFLLTGATLMGVSLLLLGIISHLNDHVYGSNPCQESVQCTQAATDLTNNFTIPYSTTPQVFIDNESYTLSEAEWLSYYMDNYTAAPPEEPHVHIHGSTLGKIAAFTSLMLYVAAFGFSFGPGNLCFDNKFISRSKIFLGYLIDMKMYRYFNCMYGRVSLAA